MYGARPCRGCELAHRPGTKPREKHGMTLLARGEWWKRADHDQKGLYHPATGPAQNDWWTVCRPFETLAPEESFDIGVCLSRCLAGQLPEIPARPQAEQERSFCVFVGQTQPHARSVLQAMQRPGGLCIASSASRTTAGRRGERPGHQYPPRALACR